MEYTELLNKIQTNLSNTTISRSNTNQPTTTGSVDTILNKIGLEVQRQGGN
jgi:hypothetical protein